tara:strand:+ start:180 stop:824 length:645 start_codon:yes stop_codon:yes gene_type:complete
LQKQIKNRDRVTKFAEVNTSEKEVSNMLNLVSEETNRLESRFLESACGDGNFLIEILNRKMKVLVKNFKKNQYEFERNSIIVIGSLYGIDILIDNIVIARERLFKKFLSEYKSLFREKTNKKFIDSIYFIIEKNLVQGNALTLKKVNSDKPILLSQWSIIEDKVKRREYSFANLVSYSPFEKDSLFSDLGEEVEIPKTENDYKLIKYNEIFKQC